MLTQRRILQDFTCDTHLGVSNDKNPECFAWSWCTKQSPEKGEDRVDQ